MENEILNGLSKQNVNVEDALKRFMNNEEMYITFFKKFLKDDNIKRLSDAIETGDVDGAFAAAHTLKGVAANLSLVGVLDDIVPMVEVLRAKSFTGVKEMYDEFVLKINNLCKIFE